MIEECRTGSGFDEKRMVGIAKARMVGQAARWLRLEINDGRNFEDWPALKKAVLQRFAKPLNPMELQARRKLLVQGPIEPVIDFYDRCREMAQEERISGKTDRSGALGADTTPGGRQHLKNYFMGGMKDKLRQALTAQNMEEDLAKVLEAAINAEAVQETRPAANYDSPSVAAIKASGNDEMDEQMDIFVAAVGYSNNKPGPRQLPPDFSQRKKQICGRCGLLAKHRAAECYVTMGPNGPRNARRSGGRGGGRQNGPRRGNRQVASAEASEDPLADFRQVQEALGYETEVGKRQKVAVLTATTRASRAGPASWSGEEPDGRLSVVTDVGNNGSLKWLVDTGASASCIDQSTLRSIATSLQIIGLPMPEGLKLEGSFGSTAILAGYCRIPIRIGGKDWPTEVIIVQGLAEKAVLGMDFLRKFDATLECQSGRLVLRDAHETTAEKRRPYDLQCVEEYPNHRRCKWAFPPQQPDAAFRQGRTTPPLSPRNSAAADATSQEQHQSAQQQTELTPEAGLSNSSLATEDPTGSPTAEPQANVTSGAQRWQFLEAAMRQRFASWLLQEQRRERLQEQAEAAVPRRKKGKASEPTTAPALATRKAEESNREYKSERETIRARHSPSSDSEDKRVSDGL